MKNKKLHLVTLEFPLFREKFLTNWIVVEPPKSAPGGAPEPTPEQKEKEKVTAKLKELFANKNIPDALIDIGMSNEHLTECPKLGELIAKIKANPAAVTDEDPLVDEAVKELEILRPLISLTSAQAREEIRVGVEAQTARDRVCLDVERKKIQLPESSNLANSKFTEAADKEVDTFNKGFSPLKLNIRLEGLQIDARQWNTTNDAALNRVFVEWRSLGIPVNEPFYQKLFCVLRDSNNPTKNKLLSVPEYANWFKDPEHNLANIAKIGVDVGQGDADFPQAFVKAYAHFSYIKTKILSLGNTQTASLEAQRNLDGHALVDKPMDFVRSNYAKFTQAIKDHDYATAGLYVLGIYAIYKSIKSLAGDKGEEVKKWIFYGVAGYAGYVFAKNAGYDILKMAGFKDKDAEVRGTPMEALAAMNLPEAQDLDYDVVLRVAEVKVTDLNDLFKEANTHGQNFIHPSQFPQIFPDLANIGYFPMGIGEEGLGDHAGNMGKRLTPKQREYIRVGQQLYKTVLVLRAAYDKTLGKEEGKSFDDAMKDPVLKESKVRHFCAVLGLYSFPTHESGLMVNRAMEKAKEQLAVAFNAYGNNTIGFSLEEASEQVSRKPGIYKGTIKGFPVYFVYSVKDKHFKVYLANEYGGDDVPGRNTIAEIPIQGEAVQKEQVGKAVTAIDARMEKLLKLVKVGAGNPTFDGGKWVAKVKMPGNPEFGISESISDAKLVPNPNGDGLIVFMEGSDTPFNLDEHNAERIPLTISLLHEMFNNPDLDVFKPFYNAKMLTVTDPTSGDKTFTLRVSNISKTVEIKYNVGATPKFSVADPAQEKEMLKDPAFSSTYVEALGGDPNFELNKTLKDIESLITGPSCPKSFLRHFGKIIMGDTPRGPLSRFDITSAGVPANYSKMVLANAKQTVIGRLQRSVDIQTSFKDVETARKLILEDAYNKFKAIQQTIANKNMDLSLKGESWDEADFMTEVIDPLRLAST
ncbi:MAG: hypothetical protein WC285_04755, partial [Candidatus Gracilibacteria bacterium]